jgi:AcrR family transcriptional regulator
MPRAFTETERNAIRAQLLEAGRACFIRYGPKKTTIDDLVKPAGIAKASFYLFFNSKESLYVELMMEELPAMMERLLAASFRKTDDAREALILLMHGIVREIESNEISRILLDDPQELERVTAGMDFPRILEQSVAAFGPLIQAIADAQARGDIIPGDPMEITYSLGLIKLLPVNKDRIPESLYASLMAFAPQVIADGLTCPARRKKTAPPLPERAPAKEGGTR